MAQVTHRMKAGQGTGYPDGPTKARTGLAYMKLRHACKTEAKRSEGSAPSKTER